MTVKDRIKEICHQVGALDVQEKIDKIVHAVSVCVKSVEIFILILGIRSFILYFSHEQRIEYLVNLVPHLSALFLIILPVFCLNRIPKRDPSENPYLFWAKKILIFVLYCILGGFVFALLIAAFYRP